MRDMFTGMTKVEAALELLRAWEPVEGYYFADSGGKDSSVVRDLLIRAGVKYDGHYCVSPIDPPQVREFLKRHHPETQWDFHARGFWKMVRQQGLPLRQKRWCCEYIKEAGGIGRVVVVGNRKEESVNRSRQCFVDHGRGVSEGKVFIRPILLFTYSEVWQYVRDTDTPYCYLYDEGAIRKGYGDGVFKRLGCVLCPFSSPSHVEVEEQHFPEITKLWKLACEHICEDVKGRGYLTRRGTPVKRRFETGEELYQWWTGRR